MLEIVLRIPTPPRPLGRRLRADHEDLVEPEEINQDPDDPRPEQRRDRLALAPVDQRLEVIKKRRIPSRRGARACGGDGTLRLSG